jgi:hypothetical protein
MWNYVTPKKTRDRNNRYLKRNKLTYICCDEDFKKLLDLKLFGINRPKSTKNLTLYLKIFIGIMQECGCIVKGDSFENGISKFKKHLIEKGIIRRQ